MKVLMDEVVNKFVIDNNRADALELLQEFSAFFEAWIKEQRPIGLAYADEGRAITMENREVYQLHRSEKLKKREFSSRPVTAGYREDHMDSSDDQSVT